MVQQIPPSHSFIVRIWLEQRDTPGAAPEWRGVIEHVPDWEKRYFRDMDEIIRYIQTYLDQAIDQAG